MSSMRLPAFVCIVILAQIIFFCSITAVLYQALGTKVTYAVASIGMREGNNLRCLRSAQNN